MRKKWRDSLRETKRQRDRSKNKHRETNRKRRKDGEMDSVTHLFTRMM
jgi:hypothetical protein